MLGHHAASKAPLTSRLTSTVINPFTFIRLIGLNFDGSVASSLPGFVIGITFTLFHLFGKQPCLRHSLYNVFICFGNCL